MCACVRRCFIKSILGPRRPVASSTASQERATTIENRRRTTSPCLPLKNLRCLPSSTKLGMIGTILSLPLRKDQATNAADNQGQ